MVIWITGLSGSGKTTLCQAIYRLSKRSMPELVVLDGDQVRAAFGSDLAYREEDRITQVKRLQGLTKMLSEQGLVVIVAVVYAHPELLTWNRCHLKDYFEVYLESSLETVRRRDPKGLYARAVSGEGAHVVGVDIPWRAPGSSDLILNADVPEPPEMLARRVMAAIPRFARVLEQDGG